MKGPFTINASISDPNGRYCIANINHELDVAFKNSITIVNVYAPNNHKDSHKFFTELFIVLEQFNDSLSLDDPPELIMAGDFNFVFDGNVDCQNRKVTNDERKLADLVSAKLYDHNLWDLVQASQDINNFTWRQDTIRSKIDYFFATGQIAGSVGRFYNKWHLLKTDHAAIIIELVQTTQNFAGRSYPKLSFNDIKEGVDREFIRKSIVTAKENIIDGWSPHEKLEFVKLMIRSNVLSLRAKRNKEISELDQLKVELNELNKNRYFKK